MENKKLTIEESRMAKVLREEVLGQGTIQKPLKKDLKNLELISTTTKPYVSPIFTMSEDEILAFVEEFDIRELATLSVAELNHIGQVLGIEPEILVEGED